MQTELDSVFYQNFEYDTSYPGIATANTAAIFKPMQTEHAAYIEEIFMGSGLFPKIGETQTIPLNQQKVGNKLTTYVADFGSGIELSKNLFDRLITNCLVFA